MNSEERNKQGRDPERKIRQRMPSHRTEQTGRGRSSAPSYHSHPSRGSGPAERIRRPASGESDRANARRSSSAPSQPNARPNRVRRPDRPIDFTITKPDEVRAVKEAVNAAAPEATAKVPTKEILRQASEAILAVPEEPETREASAPETTAETVTVPAEADASIPSKEPETFPEAARLEGPEEKDGAPETTRFENPEEAEAVPEKEPLKTTEEPEAAPEERSAQTEPDEPDQTETSGEEKTETSGEEEKEASGEESETASENEDGKAEDSDKKEKKTEKRPEEDAQVKKIRYRLVVSLLITILLMLVLLVVLIVLPKRMGGGEESYMDQIRKQEIKENDVAAVDAFFDLYYTALASGNTTVLESMYDDPTKANITTEISSIVDQYDNIEVYITPGIEENEIVAFVYNDIHFSNIDATAPSVDSFYLRYDLDEEALKIVTDMYTDQDILKYMNLVSYREPVRSLLADTNEKLSQTLSENKDLNNLYILMQSMMKSGGSLDEETTVPAEQTTTAAEAETTTEG